MSKRDGDFLSPAKKVLQMRAAFICSRPGCRTLTLSPSTAKADDFVYIGIAAHIVAAQRGGPRDDPNMSDEKRSNPDNGIFLCGSCSILIDKNKGQDYRVDELHEWKRKHEEWVGEHLNRSYQDISTQVTAKALETSRSRSLRALCHELLVCRQILRDDSFQSVTGKFTAYPPLLLGVVQSQVASGVFSEGDDETLIKLLFGWLERGTWFNHALDTTKVSMMTGSNPAIADWQQKTTKGMERLTVQLNEVIDFLMDEYSTESGIDRETVLFSG